MKSMGAIVPEGSVHSFVDHTQTCIAQLTSHAAVCGGRAGDQLDGKDCQAIKPAGIIVDIDRCSNTTTPAGNMPALSQSISGSRLCGASNCAVERS